MKSEKQLGIESADSGQMSRSLTTFQEGVANCRCENHEAFAFTPDLIAMQYNACRDSIFSEREL